MASLQSALNGCLDVTQVLEVALGNECGQAEIVLADDFIAGGVVGNAMFGSRELYGPQFPRTVVQRETLDQVWHARERIDIIKLDIEGHETKFLEGGRETISAHRPVLLIELNRVHHEIRGIDLDTQFYRYCQSCGPATSRKLAILQNAATRTF